MDLNIRKMTNHQPSPDRLLILRYFYSVLSLRSEQVAGTYGVARRQVVDNRRAYGCAYGRGNIYICVHACICTCECMCLHLNRLATNNQ